MSGPDGSFHPSHKDLYYGEEAHGPPYLKYCSPSVAARRLFVFVLHGVCEPAASDRHCEQMRRNTILVDVTGADPMLDVVRASRSNTMTTRDRVSADTAQTGKIEHPAALSPDMMGL